MESTVTGSALNVFSVTILLVLLALASWTDIKERRIPNALVVYGLIVALAVAQTAGTAGIVYALTGMVIGGTLLLPHYLLGGMGAGDVKLMAMTGAYLGPMLTVKAVLFTLLFGIAFGIISLIGAKVAHSAVAYRFLHPVWPHTDTHHNQSGNNAKAKNVTGLPYAVPILCGTLCVLFWQPVL